MDDSRIRKASDVLTRILSPEQMAGAGEWMRFVRSWVQIAGDRLAAHSRPVDARNGILIVEADHPGWIQLLQFRQNELIRKLAKEYPALETRGIAFRLAGSRNTPGYRGPDADALVAGAGRTDGNGSDYSEVPAWAPPDEGLPGIEAGAAPTDGTYPEDATDDHETADFRSVLAALEKTLKNGKRGR